MVKSYNVRETVKEDFGGELSYKTPVYQDLQFYVGDNIGFKMLCYIERYC